MSLITEGAGGDYRGLCFSTGCASSGRHVTDRKHLLEEGSMACPHRSCAGHPRLRMTDWDGMV